MIIQRIGTILTALTLANSLLAAPQRQRLQEQVPNQIQNLVPLARVAPTNQLRLAVSLPLRDRAGLEQFLRDLYDPASPRFHHYLSAAEFAAQYGPAPQDYATTANFFQTNGLAIVGEHPNRTVLDLAGPAAVVEQVFHTTLREFRHPTEARTCFAPTTEPSVDLPVPLLHVHGLDNLSLPRPLFKQKLVDPSAMKTPNYGSGTNGAYLGKDFRAAYVPGLTLTGTGQTLGLVEMDGYYANDITRYEQLAGLPAVPLQNVLIDGFSGHAGSGNGEVALDIQMAISMAPGLAKLLVYEESTSSLAIDLLNRIATDNLARQISCSWTWGTYDPGTDQVFLQYAAQGQSFFQASGDTGVYLGAIGAPADNPYITVVGGTSLKTSSSGTWTGETAWNDGFGDASGGGVSTIYPLPNWQSGLNFSANYGSSTARNIPDVAMIADNVVSISDNGKTYQLIGTSISAPLWAGLTALANQQAASQGLPSLGFLNPALYTLAQSTNFLNAFHDISTGDNSVGSYTGYPATANYDLCTGWGTPAGSNTINLLLQVAYNQVDHFSWGPVSGPISAGSPFPATVTALNASNKTVTAFAGPVSLTAFQSQTNSWFNRSFETGDLSDWANEGGTYTRKIDTTTGAAGTSGSLTLIGGSSGSYDGASHSLAGLRPARFEFYVKSADNSLTAGYVVAGQGKFRTNAVFHFRMDGTGAMGLTDGPGNFYTVPFVANQWYKIDLAINWNLRTVDYYVDDNLVMPNILFCNTNVTSLATVNLYNYDNTQAWWDQINLTTYTNTTLAVTPATTASFNNATWQGNLTVSPGGTNVTLVAADKSGHIGLSAPFQVGQNTLATITVLANPPQGGAVSGGGSFPAGTQQTLGVVANAGWRFVSWQDGNTQNPRPITVPTSGGTYTADFSQLPQITVQPVSQEVGPGVSAVFSVTATGSGSLAYLWYQNGRAIINATNSSYSTPPVRSADSGSLFSCEVSDVGGAVLSDSAKLTVRPVFGGIGWRAHAFSTTLNGTSGSNYVILVSTNLQTWRPLTTLQLSSSSTNFIDVNALAPYQFYRIQGTP